MTTIAQRVDACREHGEKIEEAALRSDKSTMKSRQEKREVLLMELKDLGCETLCFWLRQELHYGLLVGQSSRASRLTIDTAQLRLQLLDRATKRVDEILGSI